MTSFGPDNINRAGPEGLKLPAPPPEKEILTAFNRLTLGSSVDDDRLMASLKAGIYDGMDELRDRTLGVLTQFGQVLNWRYAAEHCGDEKAACLISPEVIRERDNKPAGYLLPPWEDIRDYLAQLQDTSTQTPGGVKKLGVKEWIDYPPRKIEVLKNPVALFFSDEAQTTQDGRLSHLLDVKVVWSTAAFVEAVYKLKNKFDEVCAESGRQAQQDALDQLKLRTPKSPAAHMQDINPIRDGLTLDAFRGHCPSYLGALLAHEIASRIQQDYTDDISPPAVRILNIRISPEHDVKIGVLFYGSSTVKADLHLALSPDGPKASWSDRQCEADADLSAYELF